MRARHSLVIGRQLIQQSKEEAMRLYRELVARLGCLVISGQGTLRQEMAPPGQASLWWFHPVAFRNSESSPIFDWIVQAMAIRAAAVSRGIVELVLCGAPAGMAEALRGKYSVENKDGEPTPRSWKIALYGVGSRLKYLAKFLIYRRALRRNYALPAAKITVALVSFWDWGFKRSTKGSAYEDRYFKKLPGLLAASGRRTGYFAWFDPHMEPNQRGRRLADVLLPLKGADDVVLLQALLNVRDVLGALCDCRALGVTLRALLEPSFRDAFRCDGLDWFPFFRAELVRGSWNSSIAHCQLVAIATQRAAMRFRPELTISFLEHFPYARAHYEGMRRSGISAENWAIQHAGVCHEKTFYFLHPKLEFAGEPDGVCVPRPHRVFAMGHLGRQIFLDCGYPSDCVRLSGSTRYDHIRFSEDKIAPVGPSAAGVVRVLLACSLEVETEIAMVEAASLAIRDLPNLRLRLRNHPSSRVDMHPRYASCAARIEVSGSSLAEDLAWADLILFSYSTVADEAYLQGKPAWQWLPLGFNGSALVEAVPVPQFGSVDDLRKAMFEFQSEPVAYLPSPAARAKAAEQLFAPTDGGAAARIATECITFLASVEKSDFPSR